MYNASVKSDGVALNDCLYTGQPLAENIYDVLLRFCINQVALTGDVEKDETYAKRKPRRVDRGRLIHMGG